MVRAHRQRFGLALFGLAGVALLAAAVAAGLLVEGSDRTGIILITPTVLAAFAAMSVAAPIAAGGGNELYPPDQLVAFPVRARTQYLASLVLAPTNLAWFTQLGLILGLIAYALDDFTPGLVPALVTVTAYVAMVTLGGQAVAWLVVGARQTRAGRRWLWTACIGGTSAVVVLLATVGIQRLLDSLPTTRVFVATAQGFGGDYRPWVVTTVSLLGAAAVLGYLGLRACAWALLRPGDVGAPSAGHRVVRRTARPTIFAELVAMDRASVWRSTPLRRGIYVLGLLPAAVAALAGLEWTSLVLLPGLVAAGAGLLFPVNSFCLDAGGATWLAAQPFDPRLAFWAKARVSAEICAVTVGTALLAGALTADGSPTPAAMAAALGAAVSCTAVVLSFCLRQSVSRPHRADLAGARDTPAPPGTMAVYSARLALNTTLLGILFFAVGLFGSWLMSLLAAGAATMLAARRLLLVARAYATPETRAAVVRAVASG